tara:strand:- start:797 stop:1417 length:621 start_codon:yes stop_codon:yes gene_type:complete
MNQKTILQIIILSTLITISGVFYYIYFFEKKNVVNVVQEEDKSLVANSEKDGVEEDQSFENLLSDVNYKSTDKDGNLYNIFAKSGKISKDEPDILILEKVQGIIIMNDKSEIIISSNYAEYNSVNLDTKFNGNVKVNYEDNELLSQNVDLLLTDNLIKIYNNVFFNNKNLKSNADRIQYNISNGKAVIDMYDKSNKIEILGNYGNN